MNKHQIFLILTVCFSVVCKSQTNQLDDNGLRHGLWEVDFEGTSNPKFSGEFVHGKETGTFKFYKKGFYDHPTAIMNFSEENDSVQVTYYTQLGKPISKGHMIDKKREGEWLYFHQDSDSIMMTEDYKNDTLNGFQKTFFTNGQLAEETCYVNGEKDGQSKIFAENGTVTKILNYKDGKLHGKAEYYDLDGHMVREGSYANGNKSGRWIYYSDGSPESEEDY